MACSGLLAPLPWPAQRPMLLLVVELCSLCFQSTDLSIANVVATALFGDGAAGAIVSCRGQGPSIGPSGEHIWASSLDVMGWEVSPTGLKAHVTYRPW